MSVGAVYLASACGESKSNGTLGDCVERERCHLRDRWVERSDQSQHVYWRYWWFELRVIDHVRGGILLRDAYYLGHGDRGS